MHATPHHRPAHAARLGPPPLAARQQLPLALAALALALAGAAPPARAWDKLQEAEQREGISAWVQRTDEAPVKAFRGVTEVHQTVPAVLALIADIPALPAWVFQVKQAEYAGGTPGDRTYLRFRGIWPASDRDVVLKTTVSQDDDEVVVESRQVDGQPEQAGHVRIPYLRNTFRLKPLKEGWTRVQFDTVVDPGGMVPSWLANIIATRAPVVTLEGMQREVGKPPYRDKQAADLPMWYGATSLRLPAEHLNRGAAPEADKP